MAHIVVIGGGPAGSVFTIRMLQLGHHVTVIERVAFPRTCVGESLTPGVLPLLEAIWIGADLEAAGIQPARAVNTSWNRPIEDRATPAAFLVDRARFDTVLLARAVALGARLLQPASVRVREWRDGAWRLVIDRGGRRIEIVADFVADASGRGNALPGRRRKHAVKTVALHAYWRGSHLPDRPRIDAGEEAWAWGVPVPDGRYHTFVFVDPSHATGMNRSATSDVFQRLVDQSHLLRGCTDRRRDGAVHVADATPYVDEECVTPVSIKVGDAALAIDPLSSSGVQKAVQTALSGAVVANTLLRQPQRRDAALGFYREAVERSSRQHGVWAARLYAQVARRRGHPFWRDRAADAMPDNVDPDTAPGGQVPASTRVEVSRLLERVDLPCIQGDFVTVAPAARHPRLDGPVAFVGGWPLMPLLRELGVAMTVLEIVNRWSVRMPPGSAVAVAQWLVERRVLVPATGSPSSHREPWSFGESDWHGCS